MPKKKRRRRGKKGAGTAVQAAPGPKKKSKFPMLAMMAGGILVFVGAYFLYQGQAPEAAAPELTEVQVANLNLREDRPTLSPERFGGKVRRAYSIARQIPQVLDELYCYCRCRENFRHKNLLTCYTNTHAST